MQRSVLKAGQDLEPQEGRLLNNHESKKSTHEKAFRRRSTSTNLCISM